MVNIKQKYVKKIVKYFDTLTENTVFKLGEKTNSFFKKVKIIKYFDTKVEKILAKLKDIVKDFFNNNSKISNFNKFIISLISLLFFYLFYLSLPTLYEKTWVQNSLEKKLLEEFKVNFSMSSDITYNILPKPHFLVKNSKILKGSTEKSKSFSEIKKLKVFIDQNNFFNKEKMNINEVLIDDANFFLNEGDQKFFSNVGNKKVFNKKIKIKNSDIFFKDNKEEIVAIIKISNLTLCCEDPKFLNLWNLDGEVFTVPFNLNFHNTVLAKDIKEVNITAKKLKLNITNKSFKKTDDDIDGLNITSLLNSKVYTEYKIKENIIFFKHNDLKTKNLNFNYKGELSIKPFDLKLDINLKKYELSQLLNINSIIAEFIKVKLLFNKNMSSKISINLENNKNSDFFKSSVINFNAINGKINFNKTKLVNEKIGILEINNSNLFFENDQLILNANVNFQVRNAKNLFSLFQTPKKLRNPFKSLVINLDYNLLTNQMNINNFKIDGFDSNNEMMDIIDEFNVKNDLNFNKNKRIFNQLLLAYEG